VGLLYHFLKHNLDSSVFILSTNILDLKA